MVHSSVGCTIVDSDLTTFQFSLPLQEVLRNHVIYREILGYCSPMTLLRFKRTCRLASLAVKDYMELSFNINQRLARFFDDPRAFRSLQARTGILISGSTALQFFDRSLYADSGLDLFVHKPHRREIGRWLLQSGYTFVPESYQDPDFEITIFDSISLSPDDLHALDGIASMLTFVRRSATSDEGCTDRTRTIRLVIAENTPMDVILSTHSTCAMNVIAFDKAYCLFPRATLEARRSLISSSSKGIYRSRGKALSKYIQRGFNVAFSLPPGDQFSRMPLFPLGWRWLDDEHTWVILLDTTGVGRPTTPNTLSSPLNHDPSVICNWQVLFKSTEGATMQYSVMKSDLLRYRYVVADQDLSAYLARYMAVKHREEEMKRGPNSALWALYDADLPKICQEVLYSLASRKLSCLKLQL
ncbi:hypothetical protein L227DRAFT_514713 [Lentinus tigrinus ALCF2SS1-6]|uniref:F-box domain-containing protein n=1 Tax=Lentinus tigrinus ALCF2SS1-6 TaxID=1328759 RepID=A0A5C2RPZ8_9APHY|nr:hypothetical protein L227DRAFT_514713 [Lentinus tigrinus ALCF2SS1-6]